MLDKELKVTLKLTNIITMNKLLVRATVNHLIFTMISHNKMMGSKIQVHKVNNLKYSKRPIQSSKLRTSVVMIGTASAETMSIKMKMNGPKKKMKKTKMMIWIESKQVNPHLTAIVMLVTNSEEHPSITN